MTESTKRVLLTGASGFVGRQVIAPLLRDGFEVHVNSRASLGTPGNHEHRIDLFDEGAVSRLLGSICPTHLIHLAWITQPPEYWQSPLNTAWEKSSLHLFESFVENGGRRLVGVGSCAEYEWGSEVLLEAVTPEIPATAYGSAKLSLKRQTEQLATRAGISFSWARLFFLFGPFERKERFVPSIIDPLIDGKMAYCRNGHLIRDLLYVEDAGEAIAALMRSAVEGTVNVGSGTESQLGAVACEIGAAMSCPELVHVASEDSATTEPRSLVADISRLSREVGWKPQFRWEEAIRRTIAWRVAHGRINAA